MFGGLHITDVHLSTALWLSVLLLVAGLAATLWHYRATNPPVSRSVRRLLGAARALAFVTAVVMLASPLIQWTTVQQVSPELLVLEDVSLSMRGAEDGRPRWQRAAEAAEALGKNLGRSVRIRSFAFGTTLRPLAGTLGDSAQVADQGTDLSAALRGVADSLISQRTLGVVVISDGAYNRGSEPALAATELGVPVWSVCVGDSSVPRDLAIAEATAPGVAFVGKPARVQVRLRSSGLQRPQKVKVSLKEAAGGTVGSTFIKLESNQVEALATVKFVPKDTGFVRFLVFVEPLPGEASVRNNRAEVFVHVLPRVQAVLLISSSPNADFGFLRRALASDSGLAVVPLCEIKRGRLSRSLSDSLLQAARGAVLVNFPAAWTPGSLARRVLGMLRKSGKPVVVFAQKDFNWNRFREFYGGAVPENIRKLGGQTVDVVLAGEAALHPLLRVSDYRQDTEEAWANVAPVVTAWLVGALPDSCNVLLNGKLGGNARTPVGWSLETATEKVAVFTVTGFWRWRLAPVAYGRQPVVYRSFAKNLGDWLVAPRHVPGFEVRPERQFFEGGEPVVFRARLYDLGLRPVDNAVVAVKLMDQNGEAEQTVLLVNLGSGLYRGQVAALPSGAYKYEAVARVGDRTWGPVRGTFAVKAFAAELSDLRARPDVLRRLAQATGGTCVKSEDLRPLLTAVVDAAEHFAERDIRDERPGSRSVKATPWLLLVLVGVLATEWTIRRRRGLL